MTLLDLPGNAIKSWTARPYARVSKDRSGRLRSPEQQLDEMTEDAGRCGIRLAKPYIERKAVSASRYSTEEREAFDELISDLAAGRFDADILYLWESSRGSRRVSEWCVLLELLEERGILVRVKSHGRTYDPGNPRDRRTLLEDAVDSEYESGKTSMRIRRDVAANAAAGRPHGPAPYGYQAVHDQRTGRLITWEKDPERAPVIQELFERLAAGHSFKKITADFRDRGIVNKGRKGNPKPFSHQHLRDLAIRAAYAGYRVHKDKLIEGTWEPIVRRDLWWEVQRILSGPKHQSSTKRPGKALYTYTVCVRCDVCGGRLGVAYTRGVPQYRCVQAGCIRIFKDDLDKYLDTKIINYLSRPEIYSRLAERSDHSERLAQLDAQIAEARAKLEQAEDAIPADVFEARMLAATIRGLTENLESLEAQRRQLTIPRPLAALLGGSESDIRERWMGAPVSVRRKAAEILLSPSWLGEVRVTRSPVRNQRVPAADRVKFRP